MLAAAPASEHANVDMSGLTVQSDNELPTLFVVLHLDLGAVRVESSGLGRLCHGSPATVDGDRRAAPRRR